MSGRSLAAGVLAAVVTVVIVLGAISLSLAEAQPNFALPTTVIPGSSSPTQPTQIVLVNPTLTSRPSATQAATFTSTKSPSKTPLPTHTLIPTVTNTPTPAQTNTLAPCAQPSGWTTYIVVPGDYLAQIAYTYGITLSDLRRVNCLGRSSIIHPGDKLFVPPAPTPTTTPRAPGTISPTKSS